MITLLLEHLLEVHFAVNSFLETSISPYAKIKIHDVQVTL